MSTYSPSLFRTNVIMGAIAMWSLPHQLQAINIDNVNINATSVLGQKINEMWATNGDNLSRAYAGTGALKSGFTRHGKRTVGGMFDDVVNSAIRMYVNNFKVINCFEKLNLLFIRTEAVKKLLINSLVILRRTSPKRTKPLKTSGYRNN